MFTKRQKEIIVECFAFTIFFAIISYKLTNAGLWFDETVEYWYSKYVIGTLPWEDAPLSMYDRIVSTYQPPLFNVIFHFWLKLGDSEWWLRFFGVIVGIIGALGIYKTILFGTESRYKASVSVIIYATIYRVTYYWQEVSEYALVVGLLSWTVYYFLRVIDKPDVKDIILFVFSCILPVYSQYGAIFPVMAFGILAFIKVLYDKNKKDIACISISYVIAAVFAALPLYLFFVKPQMTRQGSTEIAIKQPFSIKSFCDNFISIFKYNFLDNIGATGQHVITILIILMMVAMGFYLIKGKRLWMKYLLSANVLCYIFYYIAVFLGFYANISYAGQFANRYNLFLIPLWFVTILLLINLLLEEMFEAYDFKYTQSLAVTAAGIIIGIIFCWCYLGWSSIKNNWSKEDIRGATQTWLDRSGYETDTIIYCDARYGFSYYIRQNKNYNDSMLDKVIIQSWSRAYEEWVDSVYEEWPTSVYIVASHITQDRLEGLIGAFTEKGYISSDFYNKDGGRLIYLKLPEADER